MSAVIPPRCGSVRDSVCRDMAEQLLAGGGQLVDVRSPVDFGRDALPGALNLPVDALAWEFRRLNRCSPVILCGASEFRSKRAACLLAGEGFSRIYYLGG